MDEQWDYRVVKAPMNNPRGRQRTLNREARDGWEVVETTRGPLLRASDQVTLRRRKGYKAEQRAAAAARQAAKTPEERRREWVIAGVVAVAALVFILVVL
ncbi:hypothetical protein GCM10025875_15980 [Litorihabitans aurantiacus]|uniref:DUF4177 domain-containing protein n=2 Tax=Litorihabitans aurantiacus TaxID=1930061 RepID=A0AA37XE91_9MICO|nr:hypothetical protein GCM10025875_15980 [Litorihabitans aurantiacus]